MGQLVCRELRLQLEEDGILVVEGSSGCGRYFTQHTTLALISPKRSGLMGPVRSIGWSCQALWLAFYRCFYPSLYLYTGV